MILLVEDNQNDEVLTLRALKKSRLANEVVVVRDGEAALDFLFGTGVYAGRDTTALPELMLLDLNLPKIGGLDVLRSVREDARSQLLPVVVLTSCREEGDIVACYSLGANAYVEKPLDFGQFFEAVHALGLFWSVVNAPPPGVRP